MFSIPQQTYMPFAFCREGYYCPEPTVQLLCPKGYYCLEGSSQPKLCKLLASCPPGTVKPRLSWLVLVLLLFLCGAVGAVWWILTSWEGAGACNCMGNGVRDAIKDGSDAKQSAMKELQSLLGKSSTAMLCSL